MLFALLFSVLVVCGIVMAGIHQLKNPIGAPPASLVPDGSN